jgi:phage terminase small subunit
MSIDQLTQKQARFVELYESPGTPTFGNATESYRQSYNVANMTERTIGRKAQEVATNGRVSALIKGNKERVLQAVSFDKMDVMRQLVAIATADPTRVVEQRRICCRYCHGVGHAYQWRSEDEWVEVMAQVMDRNAREEKAAAKADRPPEFQDVPSNSGGYGWRRPARPHPDCPRCDGEGEPDVFVRDVNDLTPAERRLVASVKQTKDGIEIKMRDQDGALNTIARIFKMISDKMELTGADGGPVQVAAITAVLPVDQQQAAQMYQQLMEGKTK